MPAGSLDGRRYDRLVWWGGLAALCTAFAIAMAISVALSLTASPLAWLVPVAVVGGVFAAMLPRTSGAGLMLVMGLFATVSGNKAGIQVQEIVYAVGYISFLGWWFFTRIFVHSAPVLRDLGDALMAAFLGYAILSFGLTALNGGSLSQAVVEWVALSMLLFYFPFREICETHPRGLQILIGITLFLGAVGVFRMYFAYTAVLQNAEAAWEVARGRVTINELLLYLSSVLSLCLASVAVGWRRLALLGVAFGAYTIALIMTQWRAYYVDLALSILMMMVIFRGPARWRTAMLLFGGSIVVLGLAYAVIGERVQLVGLGLLDRLLSISTATAKDPSLINRFLESEAIRPLLWESPVLGHGMGVSFGFYDINFRTTWVKTYAHNSYLTMWYKFGLVGLCTFMTLWFWTIWRAFRIAKTAPPLERAASQFVAICLTCLLLSHIVAPVLATDDTSMAFALLFSMGAGLRGLDARRRAARLAPGVPGQSLDDLESGPNLTARQSA